MRSMRTFRPTCTGAIRSSRLTVNLICPLSDGIRTSVKVANETHERFSSWRAKGPAHRAGVVGERGLQNIIQTEGGVLRPEAVYRSHVYFESSGMIAGSALSNTAETT